MKTVKKSIMFVAVAIIAMVAGLTSCSKESQLKSAVEKANSDCPIYIMDGLQMTSVLDDGSNVVYVVETSEDVLPIELIEAQSSEMKNAMATTFNQPDTKELIDVLVECNKGMAFRFVGEQSGDSYEIVFTPAELKPYATK